jgi:2-polyprenyl-3-methyl-5-hydroxy-6-metoxy-1,4-benzoquinol methylase
MADSGDLTNSKYWEEVWSEQSRQSGLMAQLRKVSTWKYDRIIRKLLDYAPHSNADVLELGCAPGTMLQRIHRLRPQLQLSGVDYAEIGCQTTAAVLKSMGLPPHVYHGDVRTVELPQQYDLVVSFGLIEHFDDPAEILRSHARFCRPGGTVAVTLPNFTSPVVRYFSERFCPDNLAIHNLSTMNLKTLHAALVAAGLTNVQCGGDGGSVLHNLISSRDLASRIFLGASRVWNIGAILIPPQIGWHSNLWASGQVHVG